MRLRARWVTRPSWPGSRLDDHGSGDLHQAAAYDEYRPPGRGVTSGVQLVSINPQPPVVLVSLAKESKSKGWYHAYGEVIPRWFELYVGLESAASRTRSYEHAVVPGLLQTPEYAAQVVRTRPSVPDDEAAKLVELRIERQRLLTRKRPAAPALDVIIEEALLHKDVPGMPAQIDKLVRASDARNVSIRVLPLNGAITQVVVSGGFVILDFPTNGARSAEPTTVYNEGLSGALYLDRVEEVRTYAEVWNALTAQALSVEESRKLMQGIKERHHD